MYKACDFNGTNIVLWCRCAQISLTQLHAYNAAYIGSNAVKFVHVRKRNRIDVNWMATETTLREYTRVLSIGHKFFNQFKVSLAFKYLHFLAPINRKPQITNPLKELRLK